MTPWKRVLTILGFTGLAIIGAPLLGGLFLGGLFWLGSERAIYQRVKSPDGHKEARVQFDDGGAMTSWSKIVLVRSSWLPFDSPWFSCRAFFGSGTDHINLRWLNNFTLQIQHGFRGDGVMDTEHDCGSTQIQTTFNANLISDEP